MATRMEYGIFCAGKLVFSAESLAKIGLWLGRIAEVDRSRYVVRQRTVTFTRWSELYSVPTSETRLSAEQWKQTFRSLRRAGIYAATPVLTTLMFGASLTTVGFLLTRTLIEAGLLTPVEWLVLVGAWGYASGTLSVRLDRRD